MQYTPRDNNSRTTDRTNRLLELRTVLEKLETSPQIRNRLMSSLIQFTSDFTSERLPASDNLELQKLNLAFGIQNRLGIRNMLRGLVCTQISDLQNEWYQENKHEKRNNQAKWDMTIRKELILLASDLWTHRCKIVHEENEQIVEQYTRTCAYDLQVKLQRLPWSLPSASRHLLDQDKDFFERVIYRM